jgi:hypothetical protein
VDSCDVKGVAVEVIINGSSLDTQMFVHVGSKIVKNIFTKVEFVEIFIEWNMCTSSARVEVIIML